MKVNLTPVAVEILLEQKEVQTLVKGDVVVGTPDTAFLSPFGMRVLLVRPVTITGVGCGGCGTIGEGTPENLPPGWKIRGHRGGHDYRCPNCQGKPKKASV